MKQMTNKEFQTLEKLILSNQLNTKKMVADFVKEYYSKTIITKDYILAFGDLDIALVAHLDTVFEKEKSLKKNKNGILYDTKKGIMCTPGGGGFDDKAGIFAIMSIVKSGYKPHLIFPTDEETGGIGAISIIEDYPKCPFPNLKYIIELDRANQEDCVFYNCNNREFVDYVESFNFIEAFGSFSDIDVICPQWKIAGVNLSIGYQDEHSYSETLNVGAMYMTIDKVKTMLNASPSLEKPFKYIRGVNYMNLWYGSSVLEDFNYNSTLVPCDCCGKIIYDYEVIPVTSVDEDLLFYCSDCCCEKDISWCVHCGEAFEQKAGESTPLCPDCLREKEEEWKKNSKKSKKKSKK